MPLNFTLWSRVRSPRITVWHGHLRVLWPINVLPRSSIYMFHITVQDPVYYVQGTELNSTSVSKRSDRKIYTSENTPIWFLFTFEGTKKAYRLLNELPNHIKHAASKDIFCKVLKTHNSCF